MPRSKVSGEGQFLTWRASHRRYGITAHTKTGVVSNPNPDPSKSCLYPEVYDIPVPCHMTVVINQYLSNINHGTRLFPDAEGRKMNNWRCVPLRLTTSRNVTPPLGGPRRSASISMPRECEA
jgi:hypothetical protein